MLPSVIGIWGAGDRDISGAPSVIKRPARIASLSRLDIGCVAAHGIFFRADDTFVVTAENKPATGFLLELIARLQELATVPMIDVRAYARWLEK
jgi:hypothetical protein